MEITSATHIFTPLDVAVSNAGLYADLVLNLGTVAPAAGDAYTAAVTYSDGTSENIPLTVAAAPSGCATNLFPQTGQSTSLQPTFSWTPPANSGNYGYEFTLENTPIFYGSFFGGVDPSGDNLLPGGFTNAITSIPWGVVPSGALGNALTGSLSTLQSYTWALNSFDANGDWCSVQVQYQP